MKSIIFCEGKDDQYILGYYLHNSTTSLSNCWNYSKEAKFSKYFNIKKISSTTTIYNNGKNDIAIICTGGKENLESKLKNIQIAISSFPTEIEKLVIMLDRDDDNIDLSLNYVKNIIINSGLQLVTNSFKLINNSENIIYFYDDNEEKSQITIIPIIIPFDESGAIETLLMKGIADKDEEHCYIVESAKKYIDELLSSGFVKSFLTHRRLNIKAKFSSTIAVTNPDRSTATYDALLTSFDWYNMESIKKHFNILVEKL